MYRTSLSAARQLVEVALGPWWDVETSDSYILRLDVGREARMCIFGPIFNASGQLHTMARSQPGNAAERCNGILSVQRTENTCKS